MFEVCSDVVSLTRLLNSVCYIMENWLELTLSWIFSICSIMTNKIQSDLNHSQYICSYATAAKLLQSCPTLRPHRRQTSNERWKWLSFYLLLKNMGIVAPRCLRFSELKGKWLRRLEGRMRNEPSWATSLKNRHAFRTRYVSLHPLLTFRLPRKPWEFSLFHFRPQRPCFQRLGLPSLTSASWQPPRPAEKQERVLSLTCPLSPHRPQLPAKV